VNSGAPEGLAVLVEFVTMGNTSGAGTANPSGAPEFTSGFSGMYDDGQLVAHRITVK
jgi:hypothetical protein